MTRDYWNDNNRRIRKARNRRNGTVCIATLLSATARIRYYSVQRIVRCNNRHAALAA
jgi:hypothetical protein